MGRRKSARVKASRTNQADKRASEDAPAARTSPSAADWAIAAVGIGGVILGLVAAFSGVLVLFFVGFVMLVGSFLVQRFLRARC